MPRFSAWRVSFSMLCLFNKLLFQDSEQITGPFIMLSLPPAGYIDKWNKCISQNNSSYKEFLSYSYASPIRRNYKPKRMASLR